MNKYIGCKMVEAEPCKAWEEMGEHKVGEDGYKVVYPDGYVSWSPKDGFEKAYMQVGDNNTITQELVDKFIDEVHVSTVEGEAITIVRVKLINGFKMVEASACVDQANYDEKIGAEICMEKIKDKLWGLLGFVLQTAFKGLK